MKKGFKKKECMVIVEGVAGASFEVILQKIRILDIKKNKK